SWGKRKGPRRRENPPPTLATQANRAKPAKSRWFFPASSSLGSPAKKGGGSRPQTKRGKTKEIKTQAPRSGDTILVWNKRPPPAWPAITPAFQARQKKKYTRLAPRPLRPWPSQAMMGG